jgi:hypothetical protein
MGDVSAVPLDLIGTIYRCRTSLHYLLWGLSTEKQTSPEIMAYVRGSYEALIASPQLDKESAEVANLMASLACADIELLNNQDEYRAFAIKRISDILKQIRRIISESNVSG